MAGRLPRPSRRRTAGQPVRRQGPPGRPRRRGRAGDRHLHLARRRSPASPACRPTDRSRSCSPRSTGSVDAAPSSAADGRPGHRSAPLPGIPPPRPPVAVGGDHRCHPTAPARTAPDAAAAHYRFAVLALALGGFAIGTTEFVTMGLLPQIADGVGRLDPDGRARHLGVRAGRGRRRAGDRRSSAPSCRGAALLVGLMATYAVFNVLSAAAPTATAMLMRRPVPRRAAARCLLRRRVAGRRRPGRARAPRPRGRERDARPVGRQRRRRARRDLARPAARLALGVPLDRRRSRCSPSCWSWLRAVDRRATRRRPVAARCSSSATARRC